MSILISAATPHTHIQGRTQVMMNAYADLVFQFGMADENQAAYICLRPNTAVQYIKAKWFYDAFKVHTLYTALKL